MGTLFRPKGVCAWRLGRRAGRLRICGSGRFLGSLSDSVSILLQRNSDPRLPIPACCSGSARPWSCSAARRLNPCAPQAMRCEPPSIAQADESSTCSRHRQASRRRAHGARRSQGSFAQCCQHASAFAPPLPPPPPQQGEAAKLSLAAARSTSAAGCPALSSRGSTSEGRPMICGAGTLCGGGASPGGRLEILSVRSSQSPPPRRASIVWFSDTLLTAAAAPAAHAAPQRWGPRRVQPAPALGPCPPRRCRAETTAS